MSEEFGECIYACITDGDAGESKAAAISGRTARRDLHADNGAGLSQ
jgi:hypothetical protein